MTDLAALWGALAGASATGLVGFFGPIRVQRAQAKAKLDELERQARDRQAELALEEERQERAAARERARDRMAERMRGKAERFRDRAERLTLFRSVCAEWAAYLERVYSALADGRPVPQPSDFLRLTEELERALVLAMHDLIRSKIQMMSGQGPLLSLRDATTACLRALTTRDQALLPEVRQSLDEVSQERTELAEAIFSLLERDAGSQFDRWPARNRPKPHQPSVRIGPRPRLPRPSRPPRQESEEPET